jgi:hypothetical protein
MEHVLDFPQSPPSPVNDSKLWEEHAEEVQLEDGNTAYLCLWKLKNGQRDTVCHYVSKKQLVKRHIENTHLKIK